MIYDCATNGLCEFGGNRVSNEFSHFVEVDPVHFWSECKFSRE